LCSPNCFCGNHIHVCFTGIVVHKRKKDLSFLSTEFVRDTLAYVSYCSGLCTLYCMFFISVCIYRFCRGLALCRSFWISPGVAGCSTFKLYLYVGLFEGVGYLSNFRYVICETDSFVVAFEFWVLRCIYAISLTTCYNGNLLLFTMLHIFLLFCYSPFS